MSTNTTHPNAVIPPIPIHSNCINMYTCTRQYGPIGTIITDTNAQILSVQIRTYCNYLYTSIRQYILLSAISTDVYIRNTAISFQSIQLVLTCTKVPVSIQTSKYDSTGKHELVLSIPVGIVSTDTYALILFILIPYSVQLILNFTP